MKHKVLERAASRSPLRSTNQAAVRISRIFPGRKRNDNDNVPPETIPDAMLENATIANIIGHKFLLTYSKAIIATALEYHKVAALPGLHPKYNPAEDKEKYIIPTIIENIRKLIILKLLEYLNSFASYFGIIYDSPKIFCVSMVK
jgi:hypothetical protein